MTIKKFRQPDCKGTGRKVGGRKPKIMRERDIVCPDCGRTVAINYDGRIRHHVAKLATICYCIEDDCPRTHRALP